MEEKESWDPAMEEIELTPNWVNLAKYMAYTLRNASFDSEEAKYEFSTQYSEILVYLKKTDPDGYQQARNFGNDLADNPAGEVKVQRNEHDAAFGDEHDENCPLCGVDAQTAEDKGY